MPPAFRDSSSSTLIALALGSPDQSAEKTFVSTAVRTLELVSQFANPSVDFFDSARKRAERSNKDGEGVLLAAIHSQEGLTTLVDEGKTIAFLEP